MFFDNRLDLKGLFFLMVLVFASFSVMSYSPDIYAAPDAAETLSDSDNSSWWGALKSAVKNGVSTVAKGISDTLSGIAKTILNALLTGIVLVLQLITDFIYFGFTIAVIGAIVMGLIQLKLGMVLLPFSLLIGILDQWSSIKSHMAFFFSTMMLILSVAAVGVAISSGITYLIYVSSQMLYSSTSVSDYGVGAGRVFIHLAIIATLLFGINILSNVGGWVTSLFGGTGFRQYRTRIGLGSGGSALAGAGAGAAASKLGNGNVTGAISGATGIAGAAGKTMRGTRAGAQVKARSGAGSGAGGGSGGALAGAGALAAAGGATSGGRLGALKEKAMEAGKAIGGKAKELGGRFQSELEAGLGKGSNKNGFGNAYGVVRESAGAASSLVSGVGHLAVGDVAGAVGSVRNAGGRLGKAVSHGILGGAKGSKFASEKAKIVGNKIGSGIGSAIKSRQGR